MSALLEITLAEGGRRVARVDEHPRARRLALRALPRVLERRFAAGAARDLDTIFELRVLASAGGPEERFTLRVAGDRLSVRRGAAPDPRAWLAGSLSNLILVGAGSAAWTELLARGRLEMGGDPFMALRVPALLGLSAHEVP